MPFELHQWYKPLGFTQEVLICDAFETREGYQYHIMFEGEMIFFVSEEALTDFIKNGRVPRSSLKGESAVFMI